MSKSIRAWLTVAWIASYSLILACPAGYESQVSLARSARLIIGVKVHSVGDALLPKNYQQEGEDNLIEDGLAHVEVVETVRGSCEVKNFTIIGGPYQTCAPFPSYVRFKEGEVFYLLLDRPLEADTKEVVITWRCRPFHGTRAELDALLKRAEDQRLRMVKLHQELFPEAMKKAETLLDEDAWSKAAADAKAPSYATLACLRLLLCDPANFRPSEFAYQTEDPEPGDNPFERAGPNIPKPPAGRYITESSTTPWQHQELDSMLESCAESKPAQATDFNRRLLAAYLASEAGVDHAKAKQIAYNPDLDESLSQVQPSAIVFDLNLHSVERKDKDAVTPSMRSASFLLALADEANDRVVWRFFGLSRSKPPELDASLFVPMLKENPERFTENWGGIKLLLSLSDPLIDPIIKDLAMESRNSSRLQDYFDHFAKKQDEAICMKILERFDNMEAQKLKGAEDEEDKVRRMDFTGYLVSEMSKAVEESQWDSATVRDRLEELARCYPRKE